MPIRRRWAAMGLWGALVWLAGPAVAKDRTLAAPELDPAITGNVAPAARASAPQAAPGAPQPTGQVTIDVPDGCAAVIRQRCPQAFASPERLRACLDQPSNQISDECRNAIEAQLPGGARAGAFRGNSRRDRGSAARKRGPANLAQARAAALIACRGETADFCSDVPRTQADILGCLGAYTDQLSESCSDALDLVRSFEDAEPAQADPSR